MKGLSINDRLVRALSTVEAKSVSQLMEETGLAYQTIVEHLGQINVVKVPAQHMPARFLRVEPNGRPDVVKAWRNERIRVGAFVSTLTISPGADPVWLAENFLRIGRQLTEIGTAIDRVKSNPDWYEQLGGHFWLSE